MSNEFDRAETADFIQKLKQGMAAKSDPLRDAIMDALCNSRDPRIMAVRRKCSFDQLRAIVDCVASAKPQEGGGRVLREEDR